MARTAPYKEDRHALQPATIERTRVHMPGTRAQIATRMGVEASTVRRIVAGMIKHGYAQAWGQEMQDNGFMVDVIRSTGREVIV